MRRRIKHIMTRIRVKVNRKEYGVVGRFDKLTHYGAEAIQGIRRHLKISLKKSLIASQDRLSAFSL